MTSKFNNFINGGVKVSTGEGNEVPHAGVGRLRKKAQLN